MAPPALFRFKQFSLRHGAAAGLKATTDAVFFGAWAPLSGEGALLDVGAGTGLLALMAAQRRPKAQPIHLLEPQAEAFALCRQNLAESPWADRMALFTDRLEDFSPSLLYQDILCNPPFFVESLQRQDKALASALHAEKELLERWLRLCLPMLAEEGRLHLMVQPSARLEVLKLSQALGLSVVQEAHLHHSPAHTALRYLACLTRPEGAVPRRPVWYVKGLDGQPDPFYAELVRPFYLSI